MKTITFKARLPAFCGHGIVQQIWLWPRPCTAAAVSSKELWEGHLDIGGEVVTGGAPPPRGGSKQQKSKSEPWAAAVSVPSHPTCSVFLEPLLLSIGLDEYYWEEKAELSKAIRNFACAKGVHYSKVTEDTIAARDVALYMEPTPCDRRAHAL